MLNYTPYEKNQLFLLSLLGSIILFSCEKNMDDGGWPPMEWEYNIPDMVGKSVKVNPSGGEFILKNKNYPGFYIDGIDENGVMLKDPELLGQVSEYRGEWYVVSKDMDVLKVKILPKDNNVNRELRVHLSCLDVFDSFSFEQ